MVAIYPRFDFSRAYFNKLYVIIELIIENKLFPLLHLFYCFICRKMFILYYNIVFVDFIKLSIIGAPNEWRQWS